MNEQAVMMTRRANKRGVARLYAVQALYQMELTGEGLAKTMTEYENFRLGKEIDGEQYIDADKNWFRTIVSGVINLQKFIDPVIHKALPESWPLKRLETLLRAVLRTGTFELVKCRDVPAVVAIDEYVEIAKAFFDTGEVRMVNGLLDHIARKVKSDDPSLKTLEKLDPDKRASGF